MARPPFAYGPGVYTLYIPAHKSANLLFSGGGGAGNVVGGGGGAVFFVRTGSNAVRVGSITTVTIHVGSGGSQGQDGGATEVNIVYSLGGRSSFTAGGGQAGNGTTAAGGIASSKGSLFTIVHFKTNGAANGMELVLPKALGSQPGGTPASIGGGGGLDGPGASAGQSTTPLAGAGGLGGLNGGPPTAASNGGNGIVYSDMELTSSTGANSPLIASISGSTSSNTLVFAGSNPPKVSFSAGDLVEFALVGGGGSGGGNANSDTPGTGGGSGAIAFVNLGIVDLPGTLSFSAGFGAPVNQASGATTGQVGSPSFVIVTFNNNGVLTSTTYTANGGPGGVAIGGPALTPATATQTDNNGTTTPYPNATATVNNQALNIAIDQFGNFYNQAFTQAAAAVAPGGLPTSAGGAGFPTSYQGFQFVFGSGGFGVGYVPGNNLPPTPGINGIINYVIVTP